MTRKTITEPIKKIETNEILKNKIQGCNITDSMKKFVMRMIVFEIEAQQMLQFFNENPQATEEEIYTKLIDIVETLRKKLGMSIGQREGLFG